MKKELEIIIITIILLVGVLVEQCQAYTIRDYSQCIVNKCENQIQLISDDQLKDETKLFDCLNSVKQCSVEQFTELDFCQCWSTCEPKIASNAFIDCIEVNCVPCYSDFSASAPFQNCVAQRCTETILQQTPIESKTTNQFLKCMVRQCSECWVTSTCNNKQLCTCWELCDKFEQPLNSDSLQCMSDQCISCNTKAFVVGLAVGLTIFFVFLALCLFLWYKRYYVPQKTLREELEKQNFLNPSSSTSATPVQLIGYSAPEQSFSLFGNSQQRNLLTAQDVHEIQPEKIFSVTENGLVKEETVHPAYQNQTQQQNDVELTTATQTKNQQNEMPPGYEIYL